MLLPTDEREFSEPTHTVWLSVCPSLHIRTVLHEIQQNFDYTRDTKGPVLFPPGPALTRFFALSSLLDAGSKRKRQRLIRQRILFFNRLLLFAPSCVCVSRYPLLLLYGCMDVVQSYTDWRWRRFDSLSFFSPSFFPFFAKLTDPDILSSFCAFVFVSFFSCCLLLAKQFVCLSAEVWIPIYPVPLANRKREGVREFSVFCEKREYMCVRICVWHQKCSGSEMHMTGEIDFHWLNFDTWASVSLFSLLPLCSRMCFQILFLHRTLQVSKEMPRKALVTIPPLNH